MVLFFSHWQGEIPNEYSSGIYEMGLGKTIQMLSLIASCLEELKREASNGGKCCTHATLIVVPLALVRQWVSEVKKCYGEALLFGVLDANENDAQHHDFVGPYGVYSDIFVTTCSDLEQCKTSCFLSSWSWGRIVLNKL